MLGTENDPDVMEQGSAVTVVQEPTREELISDAAQILVSENEVLVGDELTEEPMPQMDFNSNLVEFIAEDVLQKLASDLMSSIQSDKQSRSEWEKTYKEGLEYLGMKFDDCFSLKVSQVQKHEILKILLEYIEYHVQGFKQPKSLDILHQVFE